MTKAGRSDMNLHDREDAVSLVKAALSKDKGVAILSKGDTPGHEFHGNQYQGAGATEAKASLETHNAEVQARWAAESKARIDAASIKNSRGKLFDASNA